jgi:hypothetical protein
MSMQIWTGVSVALLAFVAQSNAQTNAATATPADTATSPLQTSLALPTVDTGSSQTTNTGSSTDGLPQTHSTELPSITTTTTTKGLPGITQNTANIPTYHITIPSNANNPFLESSNYMDGTVFIIVGSCLAGMALVVLAWRALYMWFLYRQTRQTFRPDLKYAEIGERPSTIYGGNAGSNPLASTISLDLLSPGDRTSRMSVASRGPSSSMRPLSSIIPQTAQFYSPSAHPGGTAAAAVGSSPEARNSTYLPAGFYLRDSNTSPSPRQPNTPTASTFLSEPSTPMKRLSRTSSGNTIANMLSTQPTGRATGAPQPSSGGTVNPTTASQSRTVQSRTEGTFPGDRRSKPSQFLDELLGAL